MLSDIDENAMDVLIQSNLITRAVSVLDYLSSLLFTIELSQQEIERAAEDCGVLTQISTTIVESLKAFTAIAVSKNVCYELLH